MSVVATHTLRWLRKVPVAFILTTFALFVAFLSSAIVGIERSVVIEAQTSRMSLTFEGPSNRWFFRKVTLCPYGGPPERGSDPDLRLPCPPSSEEPLTREFWTVDWPEGARVTVDIRPSGALIVTLQDALPDLVVGDRVRVVTLGARSILYVAPEDWIRQGALTFEATATFGEAMRPGLSTYLHGGRWEFRQRSLATRFLRSSTELVKEGTLSRGVAVRVVDRLADPELGRVLWFPKYGDPEPAQMFGHLSPVDDPGGPPAFAMVAISEQGLTELEISHFGLRENAIVKPDVIDLAIASPIFIAAITFLSLLAAVTQVLGDLFFRGNAPASAKSTVDREDDADDLPHKVEATKTGDSP